MSTVKFMLPFLKRAEEIRLQGHGEPLMGKNFYRILNIACLTGARVSFNTNGLLINENTIPKIVDPGPNNINISVPDPSGNIGLGGLSLNNALLKSRMIKTYKEDHPLLFLAVINTVPGNLELANRAEEIKKSGISGIIFQPLSAWESRFSSMSGRNILDTETLSKIRKAGLSVNICAPRTESDQTLCDDPFNTMAIKHNGYIHACCTAFFANPLYGTPVSMLPSQMIWNRLEFIRSKNRIVRFLNWLHLMILWNSPRYLSLRNNLMSRLIPDGCRSCFSNLKRFG